MLPRSGEVLRITRAASVQFIEPLHFRVIRVLDWPTYSGWVWLDGYELNTVGDAVERRSIFVQVSGLQGANIGPFSRTEQATTARRGPTAVDNRPGARNRSRESVG